MFDHVWRKFGLEGARSAPVRPTIARPLIGQHLPNLGQRRPILALRGPFRCNSSLRPRVAGVRASWPEASAGLGKTLGPLRIGPKSGPTPNDASAETNQTWRQLRTTSVRTAAAQCAPGRRPGCRGRRPGFPLHMRPTPRPAARRACRREAGLAIEGTAQRRPAHRHRRGGRVAAGGPGV